MGLRKESSPSRQRSWPISLIYSTLPVRLRIRTSQALTCILWKAIYEVFGQSRFQGTGALSFALKKATYWTWITLTTIHNWERAKWKEKKGLQIILAVSYAGNTWNRWDSRCLSWPRSWVCRERLFPRLSTSAGRYQRIWRWGCRGRLIQPRNSG